jgi:N-acetylmuramoyl-L-alanine amidase
MNRRHLLNFILAGMMLPVVPNAFAASSEVRSVRTSRSSDRFRLVLDLSRPGQYRTFTLDSPQRLVIDLPNTTLATDLSKLDLSGTSIKAIRGGSHGATGSRIVMELSQPVKLDSLVLGPSGTFGDRLVFDLHSKMSTAREIAHVASSPAPKPVKSPSRDLVIVVDAGHGGKDPGCISAKGAYEKKVALAIAHNLAKRINKEKGYKARLVRTEDIFVPLRKRVDIAHQYDADMFISVHADAAPNRRARGASVFALSSSGATSAMARWMAKRENDADLVGTNSLPLQGKDSDLANVILDMSMSTTIASSLDLGHSVLSSLGTVAKIHQKQVQQAGFAVLKSPDIPSILVETGFMSNAQDSKRLLNPRHQQVVADRIFDGVHNYFSQRPPVGTYLADQKAAATA